MYQSELFVTGSYNSQVYCVNIVALYYVSSVICFIHEELDLVSIFYVLYAFIVIDLQTSGLNLPEKVV